MLVYGINSNSLILLLKSRVLGISCDSLNITPSMNERLHSTAHSTSAILTRENKSTHILRKSCLTQIVNVKVFYPLLLIVSYKFSISFQLINLISCRGLVEELFHLLCVVAGTFVPSPLITLSYDLGSQFFPAIIII